MKISISILISILLCHSLTTLASLPPKPISIKASHSHQKKYSVPLNSIPNKKRQSTTPEKLSKPVMDIKKIIPPSHQT